MWTCTSHETTVIYIYIYILAQLALS